MTATLYVVVEGDTEERFVNRVLVPHLVTTFGVCAYASRVVTSGRRGNHAAQGGGRTYKAWKDDINSWIRQQQHRENVWFTSMLDLYGLARFTDGFPGYDQWGEHSDAYEKVNGLEAAWAKDINCSRFVPYLQLHEFEALVLVDVSALARQFIEQAESIKGLETDIKATGLVPELIDDGPTTAPSKRIIDRVPQYDRRKADAGSSAAAEIGLKRLREECPHFAEWLSKLEKLG